MLSSTLLAIALPVSPTAASTPTTPGLTLRQVGAVAPPGRPDTLRCLWTATIGERRVSGSRHGRCDELRRAIEEEVAARSARRAGS
ncbi:MAG TPA: hypothetical protein VF636_08230 [Sphingomonas sp.]